MGAILFSNKIVGNTGEQAVARYLRWRLYRVVATNYYTPYGELDIVCRRGGVVVFVEVKTRTSNQYGAPELAITRQKQMHLVRAAEYFRKIEGCEKNSWRIDVVSVKIQNGKKIITHFENVIQDWYE